MSNKDRIGMTEVMKDCLSVLLDAGLTANQLKIAQECLANYALCACMDSKVHEESLEILNYRKIKSL
jgi:hypothetical protein